MSEEKDQLLAILKQFKTDDEQERKDVVAIRQFIERHDNIFVRECLSGHMTGSALVVNPDTRQILLHNHVKLNKWLQFGGHADGETDMRKVAMKEAEEESGLTDLVFADSDSGDKLPVDIEVQTIPEKNGVSEHKHLDFRYVIYTRATEVSKPEKHESQDLKFFGFEEVDSLRDRLDPALIRLILKAIQLVGE